MSAAARCARGRRDPGAAPPGHRERGFTLLEILAAFLVFSLIFATTLQVQSGAMRNTQRSADYTLAALWAQTAMESLGVEPPLEEGSYRGTFEDDYSWEIDVRPVELEAFEDLGPAVPTDEEEAGAGGLRGAAGVAAALPEQDVPIDLYEVELRVYWGEDARRMARFVTLRSVTPDP